MSHYAKPGNEPAYFAEYNGAKRVWQIIGPNGAALSGSYTSEKYARSLARQKNGVAVKAKKPERPCLCCGEPFPSEGIHNRLCNRCRNRPEADMSPYGIGMPSRRRRNA